MKRVFALLLVAVILSGCVSIPTGTAVDQKGLSLVLPGEFLDLSGESYGENADFLYGAGTLAVRGLAEDKTALKKMSLAEYTDFVRSGNGITAAPEAFAGGYRFAYEAPAGDEIYSYTTATIETASHFWILQCYCPQESLEENVPIIEQILASVKTE